MANYEDLKKKAKDALDTIADVSVEVYKFAEENAKIIAKKAKLNAEITREKALIRRLKGEIGNKYYELHKEDPEEALKQGCDGITDSFIRIAAKKKELEELKTTEESCCEETSDFECECECECEPESGGEQKDNAEDA